MNIILDKTRTDSLIHFKEDQVSQEAKFPRPDYIKSIPFCQARF